MKLPSEGCYIEAGGKGGYAKISELAVVVIVGVVAVVLLTVVGRCRINRCSCCTSLLETAVKIGVNGGI
jgi:hypothetical protein